jgi:hypothetical protein
MALRLMPRSPRRRIRLVTVVGELAVLPNPVGSAKTSANLTPATGARTTRFCRPPQRRSSARWLFAHRHKPALRFPIAPDAAASTASRTNVRDDHDTPLSRDGMGRACSADLPDGLSEMFFRMGLDRPNHLESLQQIGVFERRSCCHCGRLCLRPIRPMSYEPVL